METILITGATGLLGSNDSTVKLAKKYGAIVITHEKNYGYDQALNTGFKKAADLGMQIIISLDADGQHDPFLIKRFVNSIWGEIFKNYQHSK